MTRSLRLKPRLKEAREKKSLSQAALGRAIAARGLPEFRPNHVGLFELGYRDATWAEVEALADVLETDPYWLSDRPRPGPAVPIGGGLAKAKEETVAAPDAATPPPVAPSAAPAAPAPAVPPSRLPPEELPTRNGSTELVYRTRLGELLTSANRSLADRSLAPAEWRAWRDYAEKIKAALRSL